jgi:hypothetical protein
VKQILDAVTLPSTNSYLLVTTTVAIGGGAGTLYSSSRATRDPWPVGQAFSECELQSHDLALRHPTGVSSDGLTLFYFDGVRGVARAASRAPRGAKPRARPSPGSSICQA